MHEMQGPIIHTNTSNLYFIKVYHILRELGIKNNKFFLVLYDPALQYIDPFDINLSDEMKVRVQNEICRNIWYYVREIVRINVAGGQTIFELHRGNLAMLWAIINNLNSYVELPRQCTKSGTAAVAYSWIFRFATCHSKISFMSKGDDSVKANLKDVKDILANLPSYLRISDKKDIDNTEQLYSAINDNSIGTRLPSNSEEAALNKGRGLREPCQWFDEMPFTKYIKDTYLSSANGWIESARRAAINNSPYHRLLSSTPGILGTSEGDWVHDTLLSKTAKFDEKLYDMPLEKVKNYVSNESENDIVYIRFTYKQLGKGEDYYQAQCRALLQDQEAIDREVNLKWSRRSLNNPFSREKLDRIFNSLKTPIGTIIIQEMYILKIYEQPVWNKKYILSIDCSGMLSNDYTSMVVIDPETFAIIATLRTNQRTNYSNTTRITYAIIDIMTKIFKNCIAVIEKNAMGIAIIDNIITTTDLENRIYSSKREPETRFEDEFKKSEEKVIVYGFDTISSRREQMFTEIIGVVVNELYDIIYDEDIYMEINNIVRNKKGRLEHKAGKHDDILFAYLIGLWVLMYSKILEELYRFDITKIRPLSIIDEDNNSNYKSDNDPESMVNYVVKNEVFNKMDPGSVAYNMVKNEIIKENNKMKMNIQNVKNMDGNEMCDLLFSDYDEDSITIDDDIEIHEEVTNPNVDIDSKIIQNKKARNNKFLEEQKNKTANKIKDMFADLKDKSVTHIDELFK